MALYWITLAIPARDQTEAEGWATMMASLRNGRVVQVDREPPQGATVVGDMHEDRI